MTFGDYLPRKLRDRWYDDESRLTPSQLPVRRFFDDVLSDFFDLSPGSRQLTSFTPRVNVSENDTELCVEAELPGMDEKDVDVTLTRDGILLRGEKKEERREGGRNRYYELSYGSFERFIPLRTEIKEDQVKAEFNRGVLTITLPKTEEARSSVKKIPVQSGATGGRSVEVEGSQRSQSTQSSRSNGSRSSRGSEAQANR